MWTKGGGRKGEAKALKVWERGKAEVVGWLVGRMDGWICRWYGSGRKDREKGLDGLMMDGG